MIELLTPENIATFLGVVVFTALGLFLKAAKKEAVDRVIDASIPIAFRVVDEIARRTPNKIDDKVALGLKVLADYVKTHDITLKPEHEARAKLVFNALHADSVKSVQAGLVVKTLGQYGMREETK